MKNVLRAAIVLALCTASSLFAAPAEENCVPSPVAAVAVSTTAVASDAGLAAVPVELASTESPLFSTVIQMLAANRGGDDCMVACFNAHQACKAGCAGDPVCLSYCNQAWQQCKWAC